MRYSIFKGPDGKMHSEANFTKNDEHVSEFYDPSTDDELLRSATADLSELFSRLRHSGIEGEELSLSLKVRGDKLSVFISRDKTPLTIYETNLICRLSGEAGLTARFSGGEIEIVTASPKFKNTKLYARVLLLLRSELCGTDEKTE